MSRRQRKSRASSASRTPKSLDMLTESNPVAIFPRTKTFVAT
jgi:hypothetical protein